MNPKPNRAPASNCPDPRIAAAQAEIAAVMKKHDLGGAVILHSPEIAHFFHVVDPSWSCAWYVPEANMLRVRCLKADYPNLAAQKKAIEATTGMLLGTADLCDVIKGHMLKVAAMIGKKMEIQHRITDLGNQQQIEKP